MIKNRNMFVQVLLFIVTFGIYGIYWFYQSALEIKILTKSEEAAPMLWTILFIVPFGAVYSYYKYADLYAPICSEKINRWIIFILFFVFPPAVWFIVQNDLNRTAATQV